MHQPQRLEVSFICSFEYRTLCLWVLENTTDTETVASHDGPWLLTQHLLNRVFIIQSDFSRLYLSSSIMSGLHSFNTTANADFFVLKEDNMRGREQFKTSASSSL